MEIRRLVSSDLESCFENRLRALENAPSAFLTTLAEEKERGFDHFARTLAQEGRDKAIFGAVEDGVVVATVGIFREDRPKTRHKATIWGMYVDKSHRERGLGGKLLDAALRFASDEMRVKAVYLSVESSNTSARRLYESRGFKCWGTEPLAMASDGQFYSEDHMALTI